MKSTKPTISFIMLTWNRRAFVNEMFTSFYKKLSKKYKYEFLIIDNGSDDGSKELLQSLALKDSALRINYNNRNKGLSEYKKLLFKSNGEYIIIIDDDVIEFVENFDEKLIQGLIAAPDFGYLALDVIQNEYTNGAKPDASCYKEIVRNGLLLLEGPTGGWCSILRQKDFKRIQWKFYLRTLNMKQGEDGLIAHLLKRVLNLRSAIIKDEKCLHACGPYYSKVYGHLKRDIEKYRDAGLDDLVEVYSKTDTNA